MAWDGDGGKRGFRLEKLFHILRDECVLGGVRGMEKVQERGQWERPAQAQGLGRNYVGPLHSAVYVVSADRVGALGVRQTYVACSPGTRTHVPCPWSSHSQGHQEAVCGVFCSPIY